MVEADIPSPGPIAEARLMSGRGWTSIAVASCLAAALLLYFTAPRTGDFWWSESSRNALNGVFILDLVRAHPLSDPKGWAFAYYNQYPALTVFFYPPLFYLLEGVGYGVFGVSHAVAQGLESAFVLMAALGGFALARKFMSAPAALGAALALIAAPQIALWSRAVMLDVPALAFIIWALWATVAYTETRRPAFLYLAAALVLGAIYTKINAAYILAVIGIILLRASGTALFRNRHFWIAGLLFAIGLIPVGIMEAFFGATNLTSIEGSGAAASLYPPTSLSSWLFYIKALPEELGWVPAAISVAALLAAILIPRWRRAAGVEIWVPLLWLAVGYVVFGLISLKEPRHGITFMFPLLMVGAWGLERLLGRVGPAAALLFGVGMLAGTLILFPAKRITGYREAADFIAAHAPPGALIMFSGAHDGSFIFNLRAHGERRDLGVWRADKLLLDVPVMRQRGLREIGLTTDQIRQKIQAQGVAYVVAEDGFWDDLGVMQRFQSVLSGPDFQVAARIPVGGDADAGEHQVTIYRAVGPVAPRSGELLNLPSMAKALAPR